jgi:hypothetical protein
MSEHVEKSNHHNGFTCPKCGGHYFGSSVNRLGYDKNFPAEANLGICTSHQHTGNDCTFKWNRDDKEQESVVLYQQTFEN